MEQIEKIPIDFDRLSQLLTAQVTHPEFKEQPQVKDFLDCIQNVSTSSCCAEKAKKIKEDCGGLFAVLKDMSAFAAEIRDPLRGIIGHDNFELVDEISLDAIKNFLHLSSLISQYKIELTDIEKTWIDVIDKHVEAHRGACCQTRKEIFNGGQEVYLDLVHHIEFEWNLVKELKEKLRVEKVKFYDDTPNNLLKKL